MIYSLNGTISHIEPNAVVVECGGVGYKCLTTLNTIREVGGIGNKTFLYTHMIVREDAVELCGFATSDELSCFRLLLSVSGVGAKLAIAVLSALRPEQIAVAVSMGDSKTLTKAPGVGNKVAQRIVLELKDKLKGIMPSETASALEDESAKAALNENIARATGALAVLGYSGDEVLPFMSDISPELSVEEIIKETLKRIGSQKQG